nr:MAG: ZIP family metal transporter [Pseudomonadota bacterium]
MLAGFVGSLIAGLGTGLGALPIFVRSEWSKDAQRLMLAVAAGMMLGATFFSLLAPALVLVEQRGGSSMSAVATVSLGVLLGALALWAAHAAVPHEHFSKGREGSSAFDLGRNTLFVLAIVLHNVPEGLSVGVAYGVEASATGHAVMLSILAQNVPEGLAVAAALIAGGTARGRAFVLALATGLVEPLGGLVGALAVSTSEALLPWGLAFAAGAMLFVVSGEVIPETHVEGRERRATFATIVGFIAMMAVAVMLGDGDPLVGNAR